MPSYGFIGYGNMLGAICEGLIDSNSVKQEDVVVSSRNRGNTGKASAKYPSLRASGFLNETAAACDFVFFGPKPKDAANVLAEIRPKLNPKAVVISVVCGLSSANLEKLLPGIRGHVRTMPNIPVKVRQGVIPVAASTVTSRADLDAVISLLSPLGMCEELSESLFDVIAASAGAGPAYVSMMLEGMADGAVKMGLPRAQAYRFLSQTFLGTAALIQGTGDHPGEVKDSVCSPNGTTIRGVSELDRNNFRFAINSAIEVATKRSIEISESIDASMNKHVENM